MGMGEDSALVCGPVRGGGSVVFVADPAVSSVVPVSLLVSMVRRVSTRTVDCCLEHERQTSNLLGPPRGGRPRLSLLKGEADGGDPQPVRRHRCVQEGRQGLYPGRRSRAPQDRRDGPDLGCDHEPGIGPASDRPGDGPVSFLRRPDHHHPRHRPSHSRGQRRRDRCRHGRVPDRPPACLLGRGETGFPLISLVFDSA